MLADQPGRHRGEASPAPSRRECDAGSAKSPGTAHKTSKTFSHDALTIASAEALSDGSLPSLCSGLSIDEIRDITDPPLSCRRPDRREPRELNVSVRAGSRGAMLSSANAVVLRRVAVFA